MPKQAITRLGLLALVCVVGADAGAAPGLNAPGLNAPGLNAPGLNAPGLNAPGLNNFSVGGQSISGAWVRQPSFANAKTATGAAIANVTLNQGTLQGTVGGVLKAGVALKGMTFTIPVETPSGVMVNVPATLIDVFVDQSPNTMASAAYNRNNDPVLGAILQYRVMLQVSEKGVLKMVNLCGEGAAATTSSYSVLVPGRFADHTTEWIGGGMTFACSGYTAFKAVQWFGYRPWANYPNKVPGGPVVSGLSAWRVATNAIAARFCGDDVGYTFSGNSIDVYDANDLNVKTDENNAAQFTPESRWSSGANMTTEVTQLFNKRWDAVSGTFPVNPTCTATALAMLFPSNSISPANWWQTTTMDAVNFLRIDHGMVCPHKASDTAHNEVLDSLCSPCSAAVCLARPQCCNAALDANGNPLYQWDDACRLTARNLCAPAVGPQLAGY